MQETMITLQGYLGSDVTLRQAGGSPVANFRVASTPRRYNRRTDTWNDAPTQWYTVNAWRGLAENAAASLRRSEPVVVHGKLIANTWINKEGVEVTNYDVEATLIGHDLTRGTSSFTKSQPAQEVAGSVTGPVDLPSQEVAA